MFYILVENNDTIWGAFHDFNLAKKVFIETVTDRVNSILEYPPNDEMVYDFSLYDSEGKQIYKFKQQSEFNEEFETEYDPYEQYYYERTTDIVVGEYMVVHQILLINEKPFARLVYDERYDILMKDDFDEFLEKIKNTKDSIKGSLLPYWPKKNQILFMIMKNGNPFKFELGYQKKPLSEKYCGINGISIHRFRGTTERELKTPFKKNGFVSEKRWKSKCNELGIKILSKTLPRIPDDVIHTYVEPYILL